MSCSEAKCRKLVTEDSFQVYSKQRLSKMHSRNWKKIKNCVGETLTRWKNSCKNTQTKLRNLCKRVTKTWAKYSCHWFVHNYSSHLPLILPHLSWYPSNFIFKALVWLTRCSFNLFFFCMYFSWTFKSSFFFKQERCSHFITSYITRTEVEWAQWYLTRWASGDKLLTN